MNIRQRINYFRNNHVIDQVIERGLESLIGDANGADKAAQTYLSERQYPSVTVFCIGGQCRNNVAVPSETFDSSRPKMRQWPSKLMLP